MNPNTKKFIETWGEELIADVLQALEDKGHIATGRLYLSIRKEEREALDEIQLLIYKEDYGKYVDSGRPAGKQPPLDKIKEWCRVKGIPVKAAFPIARKIGRIGTRPSNYFRVPLGVRLALLETEIAAPMRDDLVLRLRELAKQINN